MISNKCYRCGNTNFRADRALAGRLVCSVCGTPLGTKTGLRGNTTLFVKSNKRYGLSFYIILSVFIALIIFVLSN